MRLRLISGCVRKSTYIGQLDGEITGIDLPTFVDICQTQLLDTTIPKVPAKSILHPHLEADAGKEELSESPTESSEQVELHVEAVKEVEEVKTSVVSPIASEEMNRVPQMESISEDVVLPSPPKDSELEDKEIKVELVESPVSERSEELASIGKENVQMSHLESANVATTENTPSKAAVAVNPVKANTSLNVSRRELTTLASVLTGPGCQPLLLKELDASWNLLGVDSAVPFLPQPMVLAKLVQVDLSHNNLTSPDFGILVKCVPFVEVLNLSYNSITWLVGLEALHATTVLNLSSNQIKDASTLASMNSLTSLDLSENQISSVSALRGISLNVKLRVLHLKGNPLAFHSRYRAQIMHLVPFLDSLDKKQLPVSSVKRRTKQSKSPVKSKKFSSQIAKRQAAAAAALSAGSSTYASPKKKSERAAESKRQELLQELDKLASKREHPIDADEMAKVLEQMPADQLRQYIVNLYRSEKGVDAKRFLEGTSAIRQEGPPSKLASSSDVHKRLSMPKKLPSRSPTYSKKSTQPRRHTGTGVNSLVKVSASLLSPTDAFRRKTVEGAKAAEQKARNQRESYLNELKRNRQKRRASRVKQQVSPAAATAEVKVKPAVMEPSIIEGSRVELDSVVNETRFDDWNSEALQQAKAAKTALQSLLRLSTKSDILADLQEFKEKLVDVGLWKRMSLPSIDLTPADSRYKYVKEVIEKVELAKAAVRNFVNILETAGPDSSKVKHYKDYIAEYDPVASALKLLSKEDEDSPSTSEADATVVRAKTKVVEVESAAITDIETAVGNEQPARGQSVRKSSRSSLEEDKEQIIGPVAIRSLLQQSRRGQAQAGIGGSTNSVKFRMPSTREEGVSLPDELVRQREERQFHYDNESVASSVWSIEGQASVKRLEMEVTLRSNNEQETMDNTSETNSIVQIGLVPSEQRLALPAPIIDAGTSAAVSIPEPVRVEELPKENEQEAGPKESEAVVSDANIDQKDVEGEDDKTVGDAQQEEDSLGDRIDKALARSKEDPSKARADEELSLFSDISGLSENAGDELLPE